MADVKWIKITTDIFSDEKILLLEQMPDADSLLVIWFKLLCMAGKENNYGVFLMRNRMPYTEEMLATIFRRPLNTVRLALATFEAYGMIEIEDDIIYIPNWEKHQNIEGLEKVREQTRQRVARHREKQKQLLLEENKSNVTDRYSNGTDKIRIDKNRKDNILCKADALALFETLWKMYPNKKGKASVTDKDKIKLLEIGLEEMTEAIDRYKRYIEANKDWYKPLNGSTFFKGRYQDYIGDDYEEPKQPVKKSSFNNFQQNDYDFEKLEKELLSN